MMNPLQFFVTEKSFRNYPSFEGIVVLLIHREDIA